MANSNESDTGEKRKEKELRDIIFEMISKDKSKDEIILTLQETGLTEEEAKEAYEKVQEDFEEEIGTRLEREVEKLFEENTQHMMDEIDKKMKKFKKDVNTKRDLKAAEQKEYIDKKTKKLEGRIDELQSQFFSFRANMKQELKKVLGKMGEIGPRENIKKVFSILIILIAISLITYPVITFNASRTLLEENLQKAMISLGFHAVLVFGALILAKFGKDMYKASHEEKLEEVGQEWLEG